MSSDPQAKSPPSRVTAIWWVALGLAFAILLVIGYRLRPLLIPTPDMVAPLDPSCDLRAGPCDLAVPGGGRVTFEILPVGIPVVTPLALKVQVDDRVVSTVAVDFVGVDMDMGYNRVALAVVGSGTFAGSGMLPICVRERMTWEARVLLDTPSGLVAAPFRFDTSR